MYKFLILIFLSAALNAKYTNCTFQNRHYSDICKKVVKSGVSIDYANRFLLSYFKTQKFDEISWKYLQPKKIQLHKKNEKKANNVLVKKIPELMDHLYKYKNVYDFTEEEYGVDREIVAAILLKETKLGKIKPKHDAFIVFNTIVTRVEEKTSRQKWLMRMGKTNMASIIKHCYKAKLEPEECNLPSSYAGAVGISQFMPNSFRYVKSYRGSVGDLTKMEDAIVSASYYLHRRADYDTLIDWSKVPDMVKLEDEWYEYEHKYKNASFVYKKSRTGKKLRCFSCDRDDLKYLQKYVRKVMKYNNSSNYAIGVIRLAHDAAFYK